MARRSTLADKLELDAILKKSMVQHNKHKYLPLTATTIHRLSPFWKGAKPIADMKIFDCIKIGHEINNVHADHAVAALGRIGEHCTHLLVVAPIQTSELGNVFNREEGNVAFSNDWEQILRCFPNLKWLAFVHPQDVPTRFSLATFHALRTAIVNHQSALALGKFEVNIPPAVLANFAHNVAPAPTN
ncbi:hypothetical protein EJ02DRAFT_351327 [Clathrospora elynae]|uniref:Uncharacterized protein n=1 Tax=Clathrospora elynae TaxID=706981 RepID=A0A6A5SJR0_9PLEO|nr:hypothetical protein EJ02DRAFT_351327 [Clathrospora elynae]